MNIATLIVIGLCATGVAVCIALAFQTAEHHGWVSVRAIAAIVAAMLITVVAVWAVWTSFDTADAGAVVGTGDCYPHCAGIASNAGP